MAKKRMRMLGIGLAALGCILAGGTAQAGEAAADSDTKAAFTLDSTAFPMRWSCQRRDTMPLP